MNLKEYILSLVREIIEEESTSGDAGVYSTPFAFMNKKQKKNKATYTAEKQGFKKVPDGMPSDSKIQDYKSIWPSSKKKKYKIYKESDYNKASPSSDPSLYLKASDYTKASPSSNPSLYLKEKNSMKESSLVNIINKELINEVTYNKFKNEVKFRTKNEQLHKAIKEVKRKLSEIDRIVEYTSRMKQELNEGEEGIKYWKATEKNVGQISEMLNHLANKIKNLQQ